MEEDGEGTVWGEGGDAGLHEVRAVWSPVRSILGPQLKGLVPELRAEGVLEATQHHHHTLEDLPQLLWACAGGPGLSAFSSGLPWCRPSCWGRVWGSGWGTGRSWHWRSQRVDSENVELHPHLSSLTPRSPGSQPLLSQTQEFRPPGPPPSDPGSQPFHPQTQTLCGNKESSLLTFGSLEGR